MDLSEQMAARRAAIISRIDGIKNEDEIVKQLSDQAMRIKFPSLTEDQKIEFQRWVYDRFFAQEPQQSWELNEYVCWGERRRFCRLLLEEIRNAS